MCRDLTLKSIMRHVVVEPEKSEEILSRGESRLFHLTEIPGSTSWKTLQRVWRTSVKKNILSGSGSYYLKAEAETSLKHLLAFTSNVPSSVCQRKFNFVLSNGTVDYIKTHDLIHCPIST